MATFSWRTAYASIGLATLAITLPTALFATRHARLPAVKLTHVKVAVTPLVRTRAFALMCAIFILLGLTSGGTLAHMVEMLVDRGFSPLAAAKIAGLAGVPWL